MVIKLPGSFLKIEMHSLVYKIPRFKYVTISALTGSKLELEEVTESQNLISG